MGIKSAKDRLRRFDDVFKMGLTLLAITLSFGAAFFGFLGAGFFFAMVISYFVALSLWGVGHMVSDEDFEVFMKLMAWFLVLIIIPAINLNFFLPEFSLNNRALPWFCVIPTISVGYVLYLSSWRHLEVCMEKHPKTRKLALWAPSLISAMVVILSLFSPIWGR